MSFYLVKFSMNWSDEFDVTAVTVCDSDCREYEQQVVALNKDYCFDEIGFGTNEAFYEVNMVDLWTAYTFVEISETAYFELKTLFTSTYSSGFGTWFEWPSVLLKEYQKEQDDE